MLRGQGSLKRMLGRPLIAPRKRPSIISHDPLRSSSDPLNAHDQQPGEAINLEVPVNEADTKHSTSTEQKYAGGDKEEPGGGQRAPVLSRNMHNTNASASEDSKPILGREDTGASGGRPKRRSSPPTTATHARASVSSSNQLCSLGRTSEGLSRARSNSVDGTGGICPLCLEQLPANTIALNQHVDACLSRAPKSIIKGAHDQCTPPAAAQDQSRLPAGAVPPPYIKCEAQESNDKPNSTEAAAQPVPEASIEPLHIIGTFLPPPNFYHPSGREQLPADEKPGATLVQITVKCEPWQNPSGQTPPPEQSPPDITVATHLPDPTNTRHTRTFSTQIVGRKFQPSGGACADGDPLILRWEGNNPRDRNAILVCTPTLLALGHVPADVSKWLGPLLADCRVSATGCVIEDPLSAFCPLLICIEVKVLDGTPSQEKTVLQGLTAAAAAAARALERAGQSAGHGGTGECLRHNFALVATTVRSQDGHLLSTEEHMLLDKFAALSPAAQCLFLRLLQRRGPTFRMASLKYAEVGDAAEAATCLQAVGMAELLGADDWPDILQMLTVPELRAASTAMRLAPTAGNRKEHVFKEVEDALICESAGAPERQELFTSYIAFEVGACMRLSSSATTTARRIQRIFFLAEGQDLSRFLVTQLGVVKYPPYRVCRTHSAFADRATLLAYEKALEHAASLDNAFEVGDEAACEVALEPARAAITAGHHKSPSDNPAHEAAPHLRSFTAAWVYTMMMTAAVSLLEKQRRYVEATELLRELLGGICCRRRRGGWWSRLALNTEVHLGRPSEALEIADAALADEWVTHGDRLSLQRRVLRLGKPPRRWRKPPWAATAMQEPREIRLTAMPLNSIVGLKSRFTGDDGQQCTVEELALQHYATPEGGGWQGTHSEGGIWSVLFGLLMWDVLFMDVPEVFRTPFQSAPLDLGGAAFCSARQPLLDERLSAIRGGNAEAMLESVWLAQHGTLCRGISWERHSLEDLTIIAGCVGGRPLAAICRLLAEDYFGWSGGMPDLLLWHPLRRKAKLSEVKGPRDRLSDQQRAWISAITAAGMEVEVCKVQEPRQCKDRS